MSTHAIEIIEIGQILPHPNPEVQRMELTEVWGWQCCIGKGQFKEGDKAVYIPPDYLVVLDRPEFSFLKNKGNIGKTHERIKGTLSQGLIIPVPQEFTDQPVGTDLMESLGIERYEPPLPKSTSGMFVGGPSDIYCPKFDVESYQRYRALFQTGEEVIATEKIHGCLNSHARISLPDGTRVPIKELVDKNYEGEVLGYNFANDKIVATKVLNVFKNGLASEWCKLKFDKNRAGRGSYFGSLTCTPNHQVFRVNRDDFVSARELRAGDVVRLVRSEWSIPPLQEQVLIGKVLGDASVHMTKYSAGIAFGHKKTHEEYLAWTEMCLGELCGERQTPTVSGFGTEMVRSRSTCNGLIKALFESWYVSGKKEVPKSVVDKIGPIALAFWYMDDGSLSHNEKQEDRALFATNAFSLESIETLKLALLKFGIHAVSYESNGWRIRLNADDSEKLFLLISPYVPPVMQYKLPQRYRGHQPWFPQSSSQYKSFCVDQVITSVQLIAENRQRYDLETETHNFFANGVLVHNSNARFVFAKDRDGNWKQFCGSRVNWMDEDEKNIWWMAYRQNPGIGEWCQAHPEIILYGEVFGQVQTLKYGAGQNDIFFAAFALLEKLTWIDYDQCQMMLEGSGVKWAPLVYRGPFDEKVLLELAELDSIWPGANHLREGVVVVPVHERTDKRLGRICLKMVSNRYLEKD